MKNLPKSLNILGKPYRIVIEGTPRATSVGSMDSVNSLITINPNQAEHEMAATVIHEILEAIICTLSIKIEHDDINRLETGLYQVLTENFKWTPFRR